MRSVCFARRRGLLSSARERETKSENRCATRESREIDNSFSLSLSLFAMFPGINWHIGSTDKQRNYSVSPLNGERGQYPAALPISLFTVPLPPPSSAVVFSPSSIRTKKYRPPMGGRYLSPRRKKTARPFQHIIRHRVSSIRLRALCIVSTSVRTPIDRSTDRSVTPFISALILSIFFLPFDCDFFSLFFGYELVAINLLTCVYTSIENFISVRLTCILVVLNEELPFT